MTQQEYLVASASIELELRRLDEQQAAASLRLFEADSGQEQVLASNVPVYIDEIKSLLRAGNQDPTTYSQMLTDMVFRDQKLRDGWMHAQVVMQVRDIDLHLRLRLDPSVELLHMLHWELLSDPSNYTPLCRRERILFTRYLETSAGSAALRLDQMRRALIVVVNPYDIQQFKLAPIDVAAEVQRIRHVLPADIETTVLASGQADGGMTLARIVKALKRGYGVFYLLCHGMNTNGEPQIWLEHDDGSSHCIAGRELTQRLGDLRTACRPLLVVLASCGSAGSFGGQMFLATLAPQLARAGVAAVIGFQDDVPAATIERMMPRFFEELFEDGRVDYAMIASNSSTATKASTINSTNCKSGSMRPWPEILSRAIPIRRASGCSASIHSNLAKSLPS